MEFRLLGPLEVGRSGADVPISTGKLRALLGSLLLDANVAVPVDRLIDVMWDGRPPTSATPSLHNHVMRLRRQLGDEGGTRIRAVAPGYLIQVEAGELDLDVFAALCEAGRRAAHAEQWAKASENLAEALALWRGSPLADVAGLQRDARIRELVEAQSQAFEGRIAADLEQGRHREVTTELRVLIEEQPLREAFHGQLMLALYRTGRQSESLEVFEELRRTLDDALGLEPSASVRELHRRILAEDPKLAARTAQSQGGPRFQLPTDTRVFTGREDELRELIDLARTAPSGTEAGMVVISAIDGMAGIGKTALAVHTAHLVREQFPDGQLFLDLHGYTTDLEPLAPGDALDFFLRTLGVVPHLIPKDLGERAALYRDRLDGTRTLIILDNATGAAQIRPLLPGAPGCLVLITSRRRLTGLDDAHALTLDTLPEADAIALLHKVAGPGRIPAHHPGAAELIALCGRMPLAIRITAARLRRHPALQIEDVVGQLRDDSLRLGQFQDEDRNLTTVFDSSYRDLAEAEQRLFRCLSRIPGPDFDMYAAANLTGADLRTAERLLESLLDHNLLIQHVPGRYRFHDLIRVYARTLSAEDPDGEHAAALDRLLAYYRSTAQAADAHLARHPRPVGPEPESAPAPAVIAPDFPDRAAALAWTRGERENLLAAIAHCAAPAVARPSYQVALTASLAAFLQQEGPWQQAVTLHLAAASAASALGERLTEANALWDLSRVRFVTGDFKATTELLEKVLATYRHLGSRPGEANALWDLSRLRGMVAEYQEAIKLLGRALEIYQDLGHRPGVGGAFCDLGHIRVLLGEYAVATELLERGLAVYQDLGERQGESNILHELARVRLLTGEYPVAIGLLERALAIYQDLGSRHGEANALCDLGRAQQLTGGYPAAVDLLERALEIHRSLGHRIGEAGTMLDLGRVLCATGQFQEAADLQERSLAIYRELGNRHGQANALGDLGRARHATGNHQEAADLLEHALEAFREVSDPQGEAEVLNSTGALVGETVGPREALSLYRQALHSAREVHSSVDEARALEGAARCLARLDELEAALDDLRDAVAVYRRIGAAEAEAATAFLARLETGTQLSE